MERRMRRQSAVTTAALVLFAVVLGACGISTPNSDNNGQPQVTTLASGPSPAPSGSGTSMEGEFTYATMGDYAKELADQFMDPWMQATWPSMPLPDVKYIPDGVSGPEGCQDSQGQAEYTSNSYEYCDPDQTVYVGQQTLWEFYTKTGDAGPAMGLAHEFGHHVQYELGVTPPQTSAESIVFENQADCIAGTWARYANQQGELEDAAHSPNGRSDLDDIQLLFPLIASAESDTNRDHGTQQEREAAFYDGYNKGPAGCGLSAG
jgi:predicted metalloprotease